MLLDAQVTELRGGLLVNWDVRESAFPQGVIDAMFARFTEAVDRLAQGDAGWDAEAAVQLPSAQATLRAAINATDGPVSGRCLHQGFYEHAAANPDAAAVIWDTGDAEVGATATLRSAHSRSQERCAPTAYAPVTQLPFSSPRAAIKSWPYSGYLPPGQRMCRSDSTSRMGGAPRSFRPPTSSAALTVDGRDDGSGSLRAYPSMRPATIPKPLPAAGLARYRRDRLRDFHVRFDGSAQGSRRTA